MGDVTTEPEDTIALEPEEVQEASESGTNSEEESGEEDKDGEVCSEAEIDTKEEDMTNGNANDSEAAKIDASGEENLEDKGETKPAVTKTRRSLRKSLSRPKSNRRLTTVVADVFVSLNL